VMATWCTSLSGAIGIAWELVSREQEAFLGKDRWQSMDATASVHLVEN
jgi:hypothetical protein